jgi:hypothetical protein
MNLKVLNYTKGACAKDYHVVTSRFKRKGLEGLSSLLKPEIVGDQFPRKIKVHQCIGRKDAEA